MFLKLKGLSPGIRALGMMCLWPLIQQLDRSSQNFNSGFPRRLCNTALKGQWGLIGAEQRMTLRSSGEGVLQLELLFDHWVVLDTWCLILWGIMQSDPLLLEPLLSQETLTMTLMVFESQSKPCSLIRNHRRSRSMLSVGAAALDGDTAWARINWKGGTAGIWEVSKRMLWWRRNGDGRVKKAMGFPA